MEGGAVPEARRDDIESITVLDPGALLLVLGIRLPLGPVADKLENPAAVKGGGVPGARNDDDLGVSSPLGPVADKLEKPAAVKGVGVPGARNDEDRGVSSPLPGAKVPLWPVPDTPPLAAGLLVPKVTVGKPLPAILPGVLVVLVIRVELPVIFKWVPPVRLPTPKVAVGKPLTGVFPIVS